MAPLRCIDSPPIIHDCSGKNVRVAPLYDPDTVALQGTTHNHLDPTVLKINTDRLRRVFGAGFGPFQYGARPWAVRAKHHRLVLGKRSPKIDLEQGVIHLQMDACDGVTGHTETGYHVTSSQSTAPTSCLPTFPRGKMCAKPDPVRPPRNTAVTSKVVPTWEIRDRSEALKRGVAGLPA